MHIKKEEYLKILKEKKDIKRIGYNFLMSFIFGGGLCLIGQIIIYIFLRLGFGNDEATTFMIGIMIFIAAILSAFGVYDRIGQIAKCGLAIPITGFANSMVSSAIEYRPEGIILGIGANTFKIVSSVFALGVSSAILVGIIRYVVALI